MPQLVDANHDGYRLVPERIRGGRLGGMRVTFALSRSSVSHRSTADDGRQFASIATRFGFTVTIRRRTFAVYTERVDRTFDLGPSRTSLAMAGPVDAGEGQ